MLGEDRRSSAGVFYGGSDALGAAVIFVLANIAWTGTLSMLLFTALMKMRVLRMDEVQFNRRGSPDESLSVDHISVNGSSDNRSVPFATCELSSTRPRSASGSAQQQHNV